MISAEVLTVGLKVAEVAAGAVMDFGERVIPDELKPKEKPASVNVADEIRLELIRSELKFLRRESSKPRKPVGLEAQKVDLTAG